MKRQILFIHGGNSWNSREDFFKFLRAEEFDPFPEPRKKWRSWLAEELAETHEVIVPIMPASWNADFDAWKIWFEKVIPFLREDEPVVLIGGSLGGIFLAKYLSENNFPRRIAQLHLVGAVWSDERCSGVGNFTYDHAGLARVAAQAERILIWHAEDDPVVPFFHGERYAAALPEATFRTFSDRGHFLGETFPEIRDVIRGA